MLISNIISLKVLNILFIIWRIVFQKKKKKKIWRIIKQYSLANCRLSINMLNVLDSLSPFNIMMSLKFGS